jgi:hypothetical protein
VARGWRRREGREEGVCGWLRCGVVFVSLTMRKGARAITQVWIERGVERGEGMKRRAA